LSESPAVWVQSEENFCLFGMLQAQFIPDKGVEEEFGPLAG